MPVAVVHGIPERLQGSEELERLLDFDIPVAIRRNLGTGTSEATGYAPLELTRNKIITVFIMGIFRKPERTDEMMQQLANDVRDAVTIFVSRHVPECKTIWVLPEYHSREQEGFASWHADDG